MANHLFAFKNTFQKGMKTMNPWSKTSWKHYRSKQLPHYSNISALNNVITQLEKLPPLVTPLEINALKQRIAEAQAGEYFVLQGGDCAELFSECTESIITNKFKILLQMSLILRHGLKKPILHIGRIAGQYAKPRSSLIETQGAISLPAYQGDIINQPEFTRAARTPNPQRMIEAYHCAGLTINYLRALLDGGFADVRHPEYWALDFTITPKIKQDFDEIAQKIHQSLLTLNSLSPHNTFHPKDIDFYISHEALLLPYEQALTRFSEEHGKWYNLSTHFPWIGKRTSDLEGAHIEYIRGIENPIGIKVAPETCVDNLLNTLDLLNPENQAGKITLIHRLGVASIEKKLPILIEAVKKSGHRVLWMCDPMHGNTQMTLKGIKTRKFEDILLELRYAFMIHQAHQTPLGGVHFELTGENVTECLGGSTGITEQHLSKAYKSLIDPRLNYEQALEIALMIAEYNSTSIK